MDKRPSRRQKILRRSQDRGKAVDNGRVVRMLTPPRGASSETQCRHPASRGPSTVIPRHVASSGRLSAKTSRRHRPSCGPSTVQEAQLSLRNRASTLSVESGKMLHKYVRRIALEKTCNGRECLSTSFKVTDAGAIR